MGNWIDMGRWFKRIMVDRIDSRLLVTILSAIFVFGAAQMLFAQSSAAAISQDPTADGILAEIALHCKLTPAPDKVLVAGQIRASTHLLHKSTLSLTEAIAKLGGISSLGSSLVYLLQLTSDGSSRSVTKIDLRMIRNGQVKDVLLNGGDLVFVPHILRGTPTYDARRHSVCPNVPLGKPRQFTDEPITPRRSRITAIRLSLSKI